MTSCDHQAAYCHVIPMAGFSYLGQVSGLPRLIGSINPQKIDLFEIFELDLEKCRIKDGDETIRNGSQSIVKETNEGARERARSRDAHLSP